MNARVLRFMLFLLAASRLTVCSPGQTASVIHTQDECGPIGCVVAGAGTAVIGGPSHSSTVAPAVIRSSSPDVPGAALRGIAGTVEAGGASRHDFEEFVSSTLGHSLPLFGRGLFVNSPDSFVPADHVGVPADYVIGPGDELIIRSWGKLDLDARVSVDRNGQIFLPVVGSINVAGVAYRRLEDLINTSISRQYRDFQLSVTLGQLRSIQIFVLGRTQYPGAYVVSALCTLIDALFASGGPSATGTLRDIQLKRDGRVIAHLDLYDLLLRGDKSADVPLIAGDVLFIPVVGTQVAVDGDVNTPAIYEVKTGATITELLEDAGGLTNIASTQRSVLEHIVNHASRRSDDFRLDQAGVSQPLTDGDILRVFPISPEIANAVTLRGNVAQPGRYTWHPGMRIFELIPSRDFLMTRAYFNAKNISGTVESNPFQAQSKSKAPDASSHESEINWNYAVIERLDTKDLSTHLIPFRLGEAIARPDSAEDKELLPGDTIDVYASSDLPLPQQALAKFVRIDGEVLAPGTYRMQEGETLRDLVKHAGGFTSHTYLYASELTRESVRVEQEQKLRRIIAREQQEALAPSSRVHSSTESPANLEGELALRQAYLAKLSEIHPTGRIVLSLRPDASGIGDVPEFALDDGDHFFLPSVPGTVTVLGSVYNEGALRFQPGGEVHRYLTESGGAARDADPKREFIIRADGTLVSRQAVGSFSKLPVYPGDSLVVPPRLSPTHTNFDIRDWVQTLSSFSLTALAIKALED